MRNTDLSAMTNLRIVLESYTPQEDPEMKIPEKRAVFHESPATAVGDGISLTLRVFGLFTFSLTARVFQNRIYSLTSLSVPVTILFKKTQTT